MSDQNNVIELNPQKAADIEQGPQVVEINTEEQSTAEIEDAQQYKKPIEQQFATMDEALASQLYTRLLEIRDKKKEELGEFCLIDRFNSADFISAFKDGMNSYRDDIVLCERLYKRSLCIGDIRKVYELPDEAKKLTDEFKKYVSEINWEDLSPENKAIIDEKVKEYQSKLSAEGMQPALTDVPIEVYVDGTGKKLLMTPLSGCLDDNLKQHCLVIARFVFAYFLTMRFVLSSNFNVTLTPINSGDYIDIIAMIKFIK